MAKVANLKSNIQSKIQQDINEKQKQLSASSAATKSGSTETPTVTATPKVTQTAKAVPSLKPEITPVTIQQAVTPKVNVKDLLGTSSMSLRKAATPDLLDGETNTTGISGAINRWLYEVPKKITDKFGKTVKESELGSNAINLFDVSQIDFFRFGISSAQGRMQKYYNSPLVGLPKSVQDGEIGTNILNQRNKTIESAFNKLEERDQGLSIIPEYQEAKETADKRAEQGKGIRDAIDEGRWDVVTTRVGETMGQMIPAIVVSALTKNPKAVAGTVFTTVYGDAYKRNLTEVMKNPEFADLTQEQKNDLVSSLALVEASIETAGDVLELAPFMKGKFSISNMLGIKNVILSFLANLEGSAVIEGGEEVVTEILQNIFKRAYGGSDEASLQELGQIFSDTFWIMQLAGLTGGAGGAMETHRRNTAVNALSHEAEKYDNFDEFESAAKRGGIEDEDLIQEGWAKAKGLTSEQARALKYDVNYVESLEEESTQLYEEKNDIENSISNLREKSEEKNKKQISKLEARLQEIDNRIEEISKSIEEYMETYGKQEEELPAQEKQQLPKEEGGENLSEQTMNSIDNGDVTVTQRVARWNKEQMRKDFKKSVDEIIGKGKSYSSTPFANYAYNSSGKYMKGDTEQRNKMIAKVYDLLDRIGVGLAFTSMPDITLGEGVIGQYRPGDREAIYSRNNYNMTLYGHEVLHAMMDVINNGNLSDKNLQKKLQQALNKALNDVKKQMGIDGYTGQEGEIANTFAEEWLANAFGEYLAKRELTGPKTFKQKIIGFFNKIIDFFTTGKIDKSLDKELERAFERIANGEVRGSKKFHSRHLMPGEISLSQRYNSIESSSDITQEAMRDVDEEKYDNLVKENQQQAEQQEELGEHYEDISEAGKESDKDNKTEDISNSAEIIEDTQGVQTTAQTIKDAFGKDEKKQKKAFSLMKTEAGQAFRDMFSPAISRIYNISPRVAGRLVQMEGQREIYVARYKDRAKPFVEVVSKLNDKDKLEVKKALLDYGALASEQGENIEQYKKDEVAKLKETLNKYGITDDMLNDVVGVLNELGQRYKDAGLSITLTDMYFPRTVTDYEGLSKYIAERTGVEGKERENLLNRIAKIRRNEKLTEEEKEKSIRHLLTVDYHEPGTTSKYGKERKLGKLSDWGEGIYQFYADPMESLDSYIVNMENAIQRQLFLGGLQEDAGLKGENVSFTEIVEGLVDEGKISNEDLEELKKTVLSVLNKKPSPKIVRTLKDATYIMTLTNFLSAINQLDDLGMAIIKNKNGLKHVVKAIFGKANIKYTDLGLEDSYEMFRGQGKITNWLFKKSFFSTFDRLGKTSFVNAAWDSLIAQAKKNKDGTDTKSRINLKNRLVEMYGEETAEHMMEKIDSGNYMTNGQIDIDILVDLLYQLGSTQPIFTSAMPTVYLNNPWIRLCYALQSFTITRINMLVQGAKQVYKNNGGGAGGAVVAGSWLMGVSAFLAMFGVAIGDTQDWLKDEEEETVLWKLLNEGIDEALKEVWNEGKSSWLKIWNLSLYDKKTYNREGMWGLLMSKVKPPMVGIGKNFIDAITEHNADEITDLVQYVPLIGKLLYYRYFDDIAEATGKSDSGFIRRDESSFARRDEGGFTRREESGFIRR